MTVSELKQLLEDCDDDAEVRLAHQPSWPFEYSCRNVADGNELLRDYADGLDPEEAEEQAATLSQGTDTNVVYIFEGAQIGYLPSYARNGFEQVW